MSGPKESKDQFSATAQAETPNTQAQTNVETNSTTTSGAISPNNISPQSATPITPESLEVPPVKERKVGVSNGDKDAPLLQKAKTPSIEVSSYAPAPNLEEGLKPRISVIGVGGAGCNAITNMIKSELVGVDFFVANTDAQALEQSGAEIKIQLGLEATHGLGAGSHPEMGRASAEESINDVLKRVGGSHMLFVTAGMGGGTGTGAAPVIAKAARENNILTVGVVTKPFHFEGAKRMRVAEAGIEELQKYVDTLIVIPNQNLFRVANEKTTFVDAFKMADEVLYSGVRSVTDLMMKPGLINLDFADVKAVMGEMMGKAMMGTGEADGEGRAIDAAEAAISSPLLDDVSMKGAKAVLINITGGMDMTLFEADEAANRIREEVDPNAHIIFGSTFDETLEGKIRVSCVATGIDAHSVVAASVASSTHRYDKREPIHTSTERHAESNMEIKRNEDTTPVQEEAFSKPHMSSVEEELGVSFDEEIEVDHQSENESTYDIYSSLRKDMNEAPEETRASAPMEAETQKPEPSVFPEEDRTSTPTSSSPPQPQIREMQQVRTETPPEPSSKPMFRTLPTEKNTASTPPSQSSQLKEKDDGEYRSFFSRLMGRKKNSPRPGTVPERKLTPPSRRSPPSPHQQRQASVGAHDDLDVPAFLRRKDRH